MGLFSRISTYVLHMLRNLGRALSADMAASCAVKKNRPETAIELQVYYVHLFFRP